MEDGVLERSSRCIVNIAHPSIVALIANAFKLPIKMASSKTTHAAIFRVYVGENVLSG